MKRVNDRVEVREQAKNHTHIECIDKEFPDYFVWNSSCALVAYFFVYFDSDVCTLNDFQIDENIHFVRKCILAVMA